MQTIKKSLFAMARWGWFVLLVLITFGYLLSGISDPAGKKAAASRTKIQRSDELNDAVSQLDKLRAENLGDLGLQSAEMADWLTVCRRLSLALVGCGMSLEEIRELQQHPVAEREAIHLENLLVDTRFHHYWAERFERQLVGTDQGPFLVFRRRRFREWLTDTFTENWRYDRLVKSLITAKGLWTDKPEVNFLTATFGSNKGQPDPVRLAARTSRVFLGLRIDCLQCHDDFLGNASFVDVDLSSELPTTRSGQQADFHQLAAFFTAAKNSGLQGVRDRNVDYQFQYLDADSTVSVPARVPYQQYLLEPDGDAREQLANWITHPKNHQAALAAVSHLWALMFGQPMGDSVDNLPMDQTHPQILNALADDFTEHGYDVRRLIGLIAGSQAFRVSSRAEFEITPEHERHYAVFPLVRLRPEQVAGSIVQAARVKRIDRQSSLVLQLQTLVGTGKFVRRYGDVGEDEFSTDPITISQRLLMMNGKLVADLIGENPILNTSSHVAMFSSDDASAVDAIYLSVLNRYPTEIEQEHFQTQIKAVNKRVRVFTDMMWVLINSSELAWNH